VGLRCGAGLGLVARVGRGVLAHAVTVRPPCAGSGSGAAPG
jgi:hypothetical protein